jgi:hypothetical protein
MPFAWYFPTPLQFVSLHKVDTRSMSKNSDVDSGGGGSEGDWIIIIYLRANLTAQRPIAEWARAKKKKPNTDKKDNLYHLNNIIIILFTQ